MKAMILAAGFGKRMRPLTDQIPKAMVRLAQVPLIGHVIQRLAEGGFRDLVINVSYLREQIQDYVQTGERWGVRVQYSEEPDGPLETAGGIIQALPLLGPEPFCVVSADVYTHFPFHILHDVTWQSHLKACVWVVDNPPYHPAGDFLFEGRRLTYANIALFKPEAFLGYSPGFSKLGPVLLEFEKEGTLSVAHFQGVWRNVGTLSDLQQLEQEMQGCVVLK